MPKTRNRPTPGSRKVLATALGTLAERMVQDAERTSRVLRIDLPNLPKHLRGDKTFILVVKGGKATARYGSGEEEQLKAAVLEENLRDDTVEVEVVRRYAQLGKSAAAGLTVEERAALVRGGYAPVATAPARNPIAASKIRFAKLLHESLSVPEAAKRLGVTTGRIRQRLTDRTLYGVKVGSEWRLPAFQFARTGPVRGLETVLPHLAADLHPLEVVKWFETPHSDLEPEHGGEEPLNPRDWLLTGHDPAVLVTLAADL